MKRLKRILSNMIISIIEKFIKKTTFIENEKCSQLILINQFKELYSKGLKLSFFDIGFRKYSQNSEDGILLYIFSLIGTTNKVSVEICGGIGSQNNTANLIINHGWNGVLFEGDLNKIEKAKFYFSRNPDTFSFPPKIIHAWITKDNINKLIEESETVGEIDLLSLDIDGVDYWVWKEISIIKPRVLVAEIQCIWGADMSVTVPYSKEFRTKYVDGFGIYSGASLLAFVNISKTKGYRLIGVEKYGFNAFFMRNDIGVDIFPELNPEECLDVPFAKWAKNKFLPLVKDLEWQNV
ncbi:MAG: hypothetical protein JWM28_3093 [Chitinophagaceae bacterium]|nr:hypothetical protein [Chitinophagaceae bacterium]